MIVGIDEVGRGSWAGPLVAGAAILQTPIAGLKDSKLLLRPRREQLAALINKQAVAASLGWVTPGEIDELGLTTAIRLAMQRALEPIKQVYDEIIIDGNFNFLSDIYKDRACKITTVVGGDGTVPAISAASIIAKVARDQYMIEMSKQFPHYGFEKHVGYGTKLHLDMLKRHGSCGLHRLSYKPVQLMREKI